MTFGLSGGSQDVGAARVVGTVSHEQHHPDVLVVSLAYEQLSGVPDNIGCVRALPDVSHGAHLDQEVVQSMPVREALHDGHGAAVLESGEAGHQVPLANLHLYYPGGKRAHKVLLFLKTVRQGAL